ncbi:MAG: ATP-binding cassette domain-containing protein, partial [Coriobacteriales bacterium]|nr:ATP-binding cassette domain-containing protein [Coriobacteriales bacterium]
MPPSARPIPQRPTNEDATQQILEELLNATAAAPAAPSVSAPFPAVSLPGNAAASGAMPAVSASGAMPITPAPGATLPATPAPGATAPAAPVPVAVANSNPVAAPVRSASTTAQTTQTAQAAQTTQTAPVLPATPPITNKRGQRDSAAARQTASNVPVILFDGVSKVYSAQPNKPALSNVSLRIFAGEFIFLVGHSGSGKSTFIRLINREIVATRGRLTVAGEDVIRMRNWRVPYLRRNIGC